MDWECLNCESDNECDFPFGDNVICLKCGAVHETDSEYYVDGYSGWVTKIIGYEK